MKIKRTTILILGLFILAGLTVLLIELHERFSSSIQKVVQQQSAASSSDSIPPAPPLAPVSPNSQKRVASQPPIPASFAIGDQLLYDEKLSFEDNLQRLKEF